MSRANVAFERGVQIGAITHVLTVRVMEQLQEDAAADGHADVIEAINALIVDEGLATRAELQRFQNVTRATMDQELAAREEPDTKGDDQ